jgi:hypothetical protein
MRLARKLERPAFAGLFVAKALPLLIRPLPVFSAWRHGPVACTTGNWFLLAKTRMAHEANKD